MQIANGGFLMLKKLWKNLISFVVTIVFIVGCTSNNLSTKELEKAVVNLDGVQMQVANTSLSTPSIPICEDLNNGIQFYLTSHNYLRDWKKDHLVKAVEILHETGGDFTTLNIATTYRGRTTTIGNTLFPQDKALQDRDIFEEVYNINPKMRRVAFLESGLTIAYNKQLLNKYPQWFMKNHDGSYVFRTDGVDTLQLNFLNKEVMAHIADIIVKLAQNKFVDGIQLDDHFAIWPDQGYSDDMLVAFYKQTKQYKQGMSVPQIWKQRPNSNDKKWLKFKTDQLTVLASRLVKKVAKVGSCAKVSIMTNLPDFMSARAQNAVAYGSKDVGMSEVGFQIYSRTAKEFETNLSPIIAIFKNYTYAILLGLGKGDTVPEGELVSKISIARKASKIAFFGISNLMPDGDKLALPKGETPRSRAATLKVALANWKLH